jgi:hypothetical protein
MVAAMALAGEAPQETSPPVDRPKASSVVKVTAQEGTEGQIAPVPGAPDPLPVSLERKAVRVTLDAPKSLQTRRDVALPGLRALAMAEGEATLDIGGSRQVVRPGSRLGRDTVKAVGPGRLVLARAATPGERGGDSLVVLTFDAAGRVRARVFWTQDPTVPRAPEVKQP